MASYALNSQLSDASSTSFQSQSESCYTDSSGTRSSPWEESPSPYLQPYHAAGGDGVGPKCVATLEGHSGCVFSLAVAGDMLYSGSEGSEIRSWRQPGWKAIGDAFRMKGDAGAAKAMIVVQDRMYSAHQDRKLRVWRRPTAGGRLSPVSVHAFQKEAESEHKLVATLPTVKDVLVSCLPPKNYVQVRRHRKALWIQHADAISVLALGLGVLYSASWDKSIKVWRLSDHKCLESLEGHDDAVNALTVDPANAYLYSGGADAKIKVWARILPDGSSIPTPAATPLKPASANQDGGKRGCSYMSSPAALQPGKKQSRHYHFKGSPLHPHANNRHGSHALVTTLEGHNSAINALALSGDGSLLYSASGDATISVWEREDSARHMSFAALLRGHRQAVLCLAVSPTEEAGLLCSASADGSIRLWRRHSPDSVAHVCVAVIDAHKGAVKALAMSLDASMGILLFSGGVDRAVRVWSLSRLSTHDRCQHQANCNSSPLRPGLALLHT